MLSVEERKIISTRFQTDPTVFPETWTMEDVLSVLRKNAEERIDMDTFLECLRMEEELELANEPSLT